MDMEGECYSVPGGGGEGGDHNIIRLQSQKKGHLSGLIIQ